MSVKVKGAAELQRILKKLGTGYTKEQKIADLLVAVEPMVAAAKGNVPTGPPALHLKDNIGAAPVVVKLGATKINTTAAAVAVGALRVPMVGEIFYGRFLEFGTVKQGATPWLRPAYDQTQNMVVSQVAALAGARYKAGLK